MQFPTSRTITLINFFRYMRGIYFNQSLCHGSLLSKIIHSILQIYRVNIFRKKSCTAPRSSSIVTNRSLCHKPLQPIYNFNPRQRNLYLIKRSLIMRNPASQAIMTTLQPSTICFLLHAFPEVYFMVPASYDC